jgi:predicted N-formylglutamate amidohydrolase
MARARRRAADAEPGAQVPDPVARIANPGGRSTMLLICEHASNRLPARYGTLGLEPAERESHIAWDPGALGVAQELSRLSTLR